MSVQKKTILLVENSLSYTTLIQQALTTVDLTISLQTVNTGVEALYYLLGRLPYIDRSLYPLPALIITNIHMPWMSGLELLAWMKQHPELHTLPVVLLSNFSRADEVAMAEELGAYSLLSRSSSLKDIVNTVKSILD